MFTSAYAQGSGFALGGSDIMGTLTQIVPFVLIFVIMYFLILRPQQRKQREHQDMVKNVRRGDTVVTAGGIVGRVAKVADEAAEVEVDIADGVRVKVVRAMISEVRAKGEPVKAA